MDVQEIDKKDLLNLINRRGFILEERTKTILERKLDLDKIGEKLRYTSCPLTFELDKKPIEIDGYAVTDNLEILWNAKEHPVFGFLLRIRLQVMF